MCLPGFHSHFNIGDKNVTASHRNQYVKEQAVQKTQQSVGQIYFRCTIIVPCIEHGPNMLYNWENTLDETQDILIHCCGAWQLIYDPTGHPPWFDTHVNQGCKSQVSSRYNIGWYPRVSHCTVLIIFNSRALWWDHSIDVSKDGFTLM